MRARGAAGVQVPAELGKSFGMNTFGGSGGRGPDPGPASAGVHAVGVTAGVFARTYTR